MQERKATQAPDLFSPFQFCLPRAAESACRDASLMRSRARPGNVRTEFESPLITPRRGARALASSSPKRTQVAPTRVRATCRHRVFTAPKKSRSSTPATKAVDIALAGTSVFWISPRSTHLPSGPSNRAASLESSRQRSNLMARLTRRKASSHPDAACARNRRDPGDRGALRARRAERYSGWLRRRRGACCERLSDRRVPARWDKQAHRSLRR